MNKMTRFGAVAALALFIGATPYALAKKEKSKEKKRGDYSTDQRRTDGSERRADRFAQLDRNRDGVISRNEWRSTADRFNQLDLNRDGRITPDELRINRDGQRQNQNMRFRGMDQNNDGMISRREWRGNDQSFRNQDRNRDGILSGSEVRPGGMRGDRDRDRDNDDWDDD